MELLISVLVVISGLLCLSVSIWGGYYFITGLMSWRRPLDYGWHPARTRFAVLIAARNEELVIGPLINSLLTQDYPQDLYDIWVIPNNCTDNTAQAAVNFGAKVLECTVPVKSKGEVLRFAYHRLRGRQYDAYCVFDADNVVDRRFLAEMNNAYLAGARMVPFGEQAVIGYLYARELELTAVRTIFAGRAAGLDGDTIRARLRQTYV